MVFNLSDKFPGGPIVIIDHSSLKAIVKKVIFIDIVKGGVDKSRFPGDNIGYPGADEF